jgi:hydroxymethylglutaryl-CoA lyase
VLVPNERGLDNALALRERFHEVNVVLSASETHNRKNVNRSIAESLSGLERVLGRAREAGLRCEGVISVAFGCPVPPGATGNVATEDVVSMLHEMGAETGIDLPKLVEAARAAQSVLGRPLGSHLLTAGPVDWRES